MLGAQNFVDRYDRFAKTMIGELGNPALLPLFNGVSHVYRRFFTDFTRNMGVEYAFEVSGVPVDLGYTGEENRTDPQKMKFPVEPFARRGQDHVQRWHDVLLFRNRRVVMVNASVRVNLPRAVAFPRYIPLRANPVHWELSREKLRDWKCEQTVSGYDIPFYTYYDGIRHDSLYETWEQLKVVVRDPGNVYEYYSGMHTELGGERMDGMLTSPSKTYLKLSLWSQPPVEGQLPKMTVLFRVHIGDQFVGRANPVPQNLVETWNATNNRIELVPSPRPSPPPTSAASLSHRQQLRYGQSTARGARRLSI